MAARNVEVRARVPAELKREAETILRQLQMSATDAIMLFYRQVVLARGMPFDVRIANAVTRRALSDAITGRNVKRYAAVDEFGEGTVSGRPHSARGPRHPAN